MENVVQKLKEELDTLKYLAKQYPEWIKQAKSDNNEYGVDVYTSDFKECKKSIREYSKAIKVLIMQGAGIKL